MQAHHHVSIWAIAALAVILAAVNFTNAALLAENGPSQETKEFFGADDKDQAGRSVDIPECQSDFSQTAPPSEDPSAYPSAPPNYSPGPGETDSGSPPPGESYPYDSPSPGDATDSPTDSPSPDQTMIHDPAENREIMSAACKAAIIKMMKSQMAHFYDKMKSGALTAKLDQVLQVLEKLQTEGLAKLKAAGVEVSEIEKLLPLITTDVKSLQAFFAEMLSAMEKFFAIDDPDEAFTYMDTIFPRTQADGMGKVADRLVSNVKKLQKILDTIVESGGGADGSD